MGFSQNLGWEMGIRPPPSGPSDRDQPADIRCTISSPTMRTGLDFKSAQFDLVRGEAEKSELEDLK
jgi:hypothetical protein